MESQYDIFISHSHKDKDKARFLADELKGFEYRVWIDNLEIEPGEDWPDEIETGIDSSEIILVVWTKDAKNSKWVKNEIARADAKSKLIVPLMFDDSEVTVTLQTKQHIDFKKSWFTGFQNLTAYFIRYLDNTPEQTNNAPFSRDPRPFMRNRFLHENQYLDRRHPEFALNERTRDLVSLDFSEPADSFMSVVTIPKPSDIDVDTLVKVRELVNNMNTQAPGIGQPSEDRPWLWFSFSRLEGKYDIHTEFWLYEKPPYNVDKDKARYYVRFVEGGAIELGVSHYVTMMSNDNKVFYLMYILGRVLTFINLAVNVYDYLNYQQEIQLLVNLRNTRDSLLGGFAYEESSRSRWPDPLETQNILMSFNENLSNLRSRDRHLQFIYNFVVADFKRNSKLSEQLIAELSFRLQQSFNYTPTDRHFVPNTTKLPWEQYTNLAFRR